MLFIIVLQLSGVVLGSALSRYFSFTTLTAVAVNMLIAGVAAYTTAQL